MSELNVEVARIHKLNGDSPVKAFVDIKVNDSILIKGLRVVEGKKGVFVSMPSDKGADGKYYDSIKPLTKEASAEIANAALGAFKGE